MMVSFDWTIEHQDSWMQMIHHLSARKLWLYHAFWIELPKFQM
jgi:hypothetical protein